MPTNVSYQYIKAEQEYHEAETHQQKLKALKKMLSTVPKHKGTEKLQKDIKDKIRKLKYQKEKEKKQKKKGHSLAVKKEGAAQIVFIGLPNSGKSTLLSKLSGKKVEIADYPFTTKLPEVRMIKFENVQLQGVEIPSLYARVEENVKGRQMLSIIRSTDFVVVVAKESKDAKTVKDILEKIEIKLGKEKRREGFTDYLPHMTVTWKDFNKDLIKKIWLKQNKIRVQTKARGKKAADKPVVLKIGDTIEKLAKIVHKDFVRKFKYAKVWGPSAKFKGQQVGLNHKLKDKDVVELFTK
jgi:ribosome-interacting GTPase 1